MKVKFLKSPVGAFKLAYSQGEEAVVNDALAIEMIEAEFAVEVKEEVIETATKKDFVEVPEKKKGKK
jgi:hypothetical protein